LQLNHCREALEHSSDHEYRVQEAHTARLSCRQRGISTEGNHVRLVLELPACRF
jgi:hypothetical protein